MGKRTTRIYHNQLQASLPSLLKQAIHVVLWSGNTHFGIMISHEADTISIQDKGTFWYNRKRHTHILAIKDIREIIVESRSEE